MNPNEYQKACLRTEAPSDLASGRLVYPPEKTTNMRLLHAITGLITETGELATLFKKQIFYGQSTITQQKVGDECGDILWYISLALDSVGLKLEDVMAANTAKLRVRFPDKFTEDLARDEARDREAEARAVDAETIKRARGSVFPQGVITPNDKSTTKEDRE